MLETYCATYAIEIEYSIFGSFLSFPQPERLRGHSVGPYELEELMESRGFDGQSTYRCDRLGVVDMPRDKNRSCVSTSVLAT